MGPAAWQWAGDVMSRWVPGACFAFAALVSFGHITDFLVRSGQSPTIAPLYAGVIDVLWYGAMVKLRETLRLPSYTIGILAGFAFVAAVVVSTGANMLSGVEGEIPRYASLIVAALPPLIACLAGLMFHADRAVGAEPRGSLVDRWFGSGDQGQGQGQGQGFTHRASRQGGPPVVSHVGTERSLGRRHRLSVDGCPTCGHEVALPPAAAASPNDRVAALVAAHVAAGGRVFQRDRNRYDPDLVRAVASVLGVDDRMARRRLAAFRKAPR